MIVIQQHGPLGELRDFNNIVSTFDELQVVQKWVVLIEECFGERAYEFDQLCYPDLVTFDASEFRSLYSSIYQTVDGLFIGLKDGKEWCRLRVVDSTSWDISGPASLELKVLKFFGGHVYPASDT